jgi:N-acetylmuramoyl-L-alanine amidase
MQEVGIYKEKRSKIKENNPDKTNKVQKNLDLKSKSGYEKSLQRLLDIRYWSSDDYTRVVLDLDDSAEYSHFLLNPDPDLHTPHRLVVDLKETLLGQEICDELKIQDGILKRVRSGQYRKSIARVVLDVAHLKDYRVFSLDEPYRVVLDVNAPAHIGKAKEVQDQERKSKLDKETQKYSGSLVQQLGLDIRTVMLDPGHGGKDPGAVYKTIYEKDINLRLSKILGELLGSNGYHVLYTRTKDEFVPLEERTALANSKKADLFISLHVNAHKNKHINGFEIYFLNLAKNKDAVRVAARENSVSTKKISDLQVILTDLMLNSKIKESKKLADKVLDKTLENGRKYYKLNDHGVRQAPFYVLMGAKMPAVLVEVGYITNFKDRKRLQSDNFLKRVAQGIVQGITSYRNELTKYARLK